MAGQQTLESLAQQAHQDGGLATAGDGNHQGRAIYDGGKDETGAFGVIHHIDEQTQLVGALINQGVDLEIVGGGHHQDLIGQMGRRKTLDQMSETAGKFGEFGFNLGGDQGQPCACRQQQTRLAQGHLAPAYQQDGAAFQPGKHR